MISIGRQCILRENPENMNSVGGKILAFSRMIWRRFWSLSSSGRGMMSFPAGSGLKEWLRQ
jgi:hypothetical protein